MEDNTIKDLVSDMLSNIVLGDKPEEEEVTSTGLMSSLPGISTPTQVQQQDEQEAAPKARDKVKEFILRLSDEAEDTNSLRYSEKAAPEITDVMVDSETLLNRYATPLYVYARNLRDYNPERSTIKVRNRGDHSERFLDQMYELARQSSEEAALARMEMGITESLPRSAPRMGFDVQGLIDAVNRENALRAGTKPLPSIPEVKTEELDDEEVAILSDTDIDTDDADGGAAPSDGKGLMAKPYDELRMREINEPLGEGLVSPDAGMLRPRARPVNSIIDAVTNADVVTGGKVDMNKVENVILNTIGNNIYSAGLLGVIKTEIGEGVKDESPYYSLIGARDTWDSTDKVLKTLPADVQARLKADAKKGIRTGGEATSADRKMLGEAMFDEEYDGRKKYKGRGLIQLTHKYNYEEVGKRIGVDLVAKPELVNSPKYAVPAAIAYMEMRGFFKLKPNQVTQNKLQELVNPKASDNIKKKRWNYVKDYLDKNTGEASDLTTSLRPRARPKDDEFEVASN